MLDSQMLPRKKADPEKGQPAFVWDTRQSSMIGMLLSGGVVRGLAELGAIYGPLNRAKMLEAHPLEQFIDEAGPPPPIGAAGGSDRMISYVCSLGRGMRAWHRGHGLRP